LQNQNFRRQSTSSGAKGVEPTEGTLEEVALNEQRFRFTTVQRSQVKPGSR
jgi:hypothetical protein